jgi:predicted outer membrane repeat protein
LPTAAPAPAWPPARPSWSARCGATLTSDPRLTALGNYGGPTQTFALRPRSPAIDAADSASCADALVAGKDQRGAPRDQDSGCDLGAFESRGFALAITSGATQDTFPNTAFPAPLGVRLTANDSGVAVGAGEAITFMAPASGASLTTSIFTRTTDASSSVIAAVVANGSLGRYTVTAATSSASDPVSFDLLNCATNPQVTNANDSGAGSLRQALGQACFGDTISFASSFTIYLDSPLEISSPIALDATGRSVVVSGDSGHDGTRNIRPFTVASNGALTLNSMQVVSGTAVFGGGIYSEGTLTIIDSTFTDNRTSASDGAAINNRGALTITGSTFSDNRAAYHGGVLFTTGAVTITASTFSHNAANVHGGAFYQRGGSLNISDSLVSDHSANTGGAIMSWQGTSILTVTNSTFSDNVATGYGGAISAWGTALITGSTFTGNTAFGAGAVSLIGQSRVVNSTFAGNSATTEGGGIYVGDKLVTITNSTLSGNSAPAGANLAIYWLSSVSIVNSIAANSSADCAIIQDEDVMKANTTPLTLTTTLIEDGSCGATLSGDPLLDALGDYGGATQTFGLLADSPAIDAGTLSACPATDQRGVSRPQGSRCDLGAFELEQPYHSIFLPFIRR